MLIWRIAERSDRCGDFPNLKVEKDYDTLSAKIIFRTNSCFKKYLLHLGPFISCIIKIKKPLVIYGRIFYS